MAGDPFSSHPYPARKNILPLQFHCEACDKVLRTIDKGAHERGKKHAEKVREKNPPPDNHGGNENASNTGARGGGCHNCGQPHLARDCTEPRKDTRECHSCGEVGHAKADCPNRPRSTCHNCGEEGHRKNECTNERLITCRNCNNTGHVAKECPEEPNMANFKCNNCENMGHKARDCPEPKDWSKVRCNNCGGMGHTFKRCTAEPATMDISETWDNGKAAGEDTQTASSGTWDDTAAAPEDPPAKPWDDTAVDEPSNSITDSWGAGATTTSSGGFARQSSGAW